MVWSTRLSSCSFIDILDSLACGIIITDDHRRVLFMNRNAEADMALTREHLCGCDIASLLHFSTPDPTGSAVIPRASAPEHAPAPVC